MVTAKNMHIVAKYNESHLYLQCSLILHLATCYHSQVKLVVDKGSFLLILI